MINRADLVLLWSLLGASLMTGCRKPSNSLDTLLAAMSRSVGAQQWQSYTAVVSTGKYSIGGVTGHFNQVTDIHLGQEYDTFKGGLLAGRRGITNDQSWTADEGGVVTVEDGPEAKADAVTEAYINRMGWLHPSETDKLQIADAKTEGADTYVLLNVQPTGGRNFTLFINKATYLVDRIVRQGADQRADTTFLREYRRTGGVMYPFETDNPDQDVRLTVESIRLSSDPLDLSFRAPAANVQDATLHNHLSSSTVPFLLSDGRIVVNVSIDGAPPLPFLLDSGAMNILTPDTVKRLHLAATGEVALGGTGEVQVSGQTLPVAKVELAEAQMLNQQFLVVDLPAFARNSGGKEPIAGVLGFELFSRFPIRIDYSNKIATLFRPNVPIQRPENSQPTRLFFNSRTPFILMSIAGSEGYFGLDSGDNKAITLFASFVEHSSIPVLPPGLPSQAAGFGGRAVTVLTRVPEVAVGEFVLRSPLVEISFAQAGLFALSRSAGNLGYKFLRQFVILYDYPARIAYFQRSSEFGASMPYNRSGLQWKTEADDAHLVESVIPDSPAWQAGVKPGDQIVGLNGRALTSRDSAFWDAALSSPPETIINLTLLREGHEHHAAVRLRELLPVHGSYVPFRANLFSGVAPQPHDLR